jgi:hypothetical protein
MNDYVAKLEKLATKRDECHCKCEEKPSMVTIPNTSEVITEEGALEAVEKALQSIAETQLEACHKRCDDTFEKGKKDLLDPIYKEYYDKCGNDPTQPTTPPPPPIGSCATRKP